MKIRMIIAVLLCSAALVSAQSLFTASLDGAQDGGGARQGTGFVNLSLTGNTLTLNGAFSGITTPSTAAHIHGPSGPFPQSAGVIYNLGGPVIPIGVTSGNINGSVTLADIGTYTLSQQLADLNNSRWYVNIHDSTFPGGEIRGAIVPVPEPSTWALMGFSALGLIWSLRRKKA
jgi:hypothetical protein